MTTLLICRDALEDSVLGNIALARAAAARGRQAVVLFTAEALAALDTGTFRWAPDFKTRDARRAVIAGAEQAGLPFAHRELDARWSDVRALVRAVADEPNLRLVACPIWSRLLGLGDEPGHLERIGEEELLVLLETADTVVGGY